MDIGVVMPTTVPGGSDPAMADFAVAAENLGFRTLAVLDRLVYDSCDGLIALAAAAAVTSRIRLATTVLLAPYRGSVAVLAKQLASIDRLSAGRLVVGVAAGGRGDDFTAAGAAYHRRGRLLDSMLVDLRAIWAGNGRVPGIGPRPHNGDIPIWVGGHSAAALRRAARHGVGWIAPGGSVQMFPDLIARARDAFSAAGRTETPRVAALAYLALGARRAAAGADYLRHYYTYLGEKSSRLAANVIADEDRLRSTIDGYAAAGCDELLLTPCTSDVAQLDSIAKVAFA